MTFGVSSEQLFPQEKKKGCLIINRTYDKQAQKDIIHT